MLEVRDDGLVGVALLEARDLLFARLLQYKAFKEVAVLLDERMRAESTRLPRSVPLDPEVAAAFAGAAVHLVLFGSVVPAYVGSDSLVLSTTALKGIATNLVSPEIRKL